MITKNQITGFSEFNEEEFIKAANRLAELRFIRPVEIIAIKKRTNKAPVKVMREAKNHEQLKVWGLRK